MKSTFICLCLLFEEFHVRFGTRSMERVMKKVKYTPKICLSYFAVDP